LAVIHGVLPISTLGRRLRLGLLAFALWPGAAMGQGADDPRTQTPCTPASCRVSLDRLTTQEARPLAFRGSTTVQAQRDILSRYGDTFGCLVPEARDQPELDLLAIDWVTLLASDPDQGEALRFCLLRLLSTLDDIELVEAWARGSGFEGLSRTIPMAMPDAVRLPPPALVLHGVWDSETWHRHRPSRMYDWFGVSTIRGGYLLVEFDTEGRVRDAVVSHNSTFN
jgi:hypothetical protein